MSIVKSLSTFICVFLIFVLVPALGDVEDSNPVAEVTAAVTAFNLAYEKNDLEEYFSYYCENATMWVNTDFVSITDYRKDWYELIGAGGGVQKNTVFDIRVQAGPGGDAAVASYRLEIETGQPGGETTRDKAQETDTWFNSDGKWCVAHLHYSFQSVE